MTLGQVINKYIREHYMSVNAFAKSVGKSSTYINYLINGKTPSGATPSPTIDTYRACAKAMGMDVDELVRMTDNTLLLNNDFEYSEATKYLFNALHGASEEDIMKVAKILEIIKK